MKKPTRSASTPSTPSLRSTLEGLTSSFVDAILVAARESLLDLAHREPAAPRERAQARRATPSVTSGSSVSSAGRPAPKARARRPAPAKADVYPAAQIAADAAGDLAITDPLALLAALETGGPLGGGGDDAFYEEPSYRAMPAILEAPVAAAPVVPAPESSPALREGEVIVRRSAAGVVLRRRRA